MMNEIIYNRDVIHCRANVCEKKKDCIRFAMHTMLYEKEPKEEFLVHYLKNEECCIKNDYVYYKPIK